MNLPKAIDVSEFARHVAATNPFIRDRVTQADSSDADVVAIHEKEFKKLVRRIDEVRKHQNSVGIFLVGAPGVGKSHVLARLFRWAREDGDATLVYLHNVLASPERMGRYLLHATVNSLAGYRPSAYAQSALYALINRAVGARLRGRGVKGASPKLALRKEILEEIGGEIDPDRLVMPVFIAYLEQAMGANLAQPKAEARAEAAVHWLGGETIDSDVAQSIGLRVNSEEGACIDDDVAVQRALDVICRLCACAGRPFVLCLDQVDNLDAEKVTALTSFLHAAIDNGHNLAVILSGVRESMAGFEDSGVIPRAAMDRLAQHRIVLSKVSTEQARQIVEERIRRFAAPFKDVKEVAKPRKKDPLVPLTSAWWTKRVGNSIEIRPRDVIRWAREAWETEQEAIEALGAERWLTELGIVRPQPVKHVVPIRDAIDDVVSKKVAQAVAERKLNPERLPPDADNLATLTLTLLGACYDHDSYTLRSAERIRTKGRVPAYDMFVGEETQQGETVTNGLTFLTADNALKATFALQRLVNDPEPPTHQLLITDEERRPLQLGQKGGELYEKLAAAGRFAHLKLSFEDYATLDAISTVLGAARVGDLDVEQEPGHYRPISEAECSESLHRKGLFISHPLLQELLTEERKPPASSTQPDSSVNEQIRRHIMGELTWALGMTAREMAQIVVDRTEQSPDRVESIWVIVKSVAEAMHTQGQIFASAQDDDLFLQLAQSHE